MPEATRDIPLTWTELNYLLLLHMYVLSIRGTIHNHRAVLMGAASAFVLLITRRPRSTPKFAEAKSCFALRILTVRDADASAASPKLCGALATKMSELTNGAPAVRACVEPLCPTLLRTVNEASPFHHKVHDQPSTEVRMSLAFGEAAEGEDGHRP